MTGTEDNEVDSLLKACLFHKKCSKRDVLVEVIRGYNVIAAGGTKSGKTTFLTAILTVFARMGDRVVILEDTPELQCAADSTVLCLRWLEELTQRAEERPHQAMIAEAVDVIVYLKMNRLRREVGRN